MSDFKMVSIFEWMERVLPMYQSEKKDDKVLLSSSMLEEANRQMVQYAFQAGQQHQLERKPPSITRMNLMERGFRETQQLPLTPPPYFDTFEFNPKERGAYIHCIFERFNDQPPVVFVVLNYGQTKLKATIDDMAQMEALIQAFIVND